MATFGLMNFKKVLTANKGAIGGAVVGTIGIGAVNFGLGAIKVGGVSLSSKIPAGLARFMPFISAAVASAVGWMVLKKVQPKYANQFAGGALAAGAVLTTAGFLQGTKIPAMNGFVTYQLPGMGYVVPSSSGRLMANAGRMAGLADLGVLVPDTGNPRMNGLAASTLGDYVEYETYGG